MSPTELPAGPPRAERETYFGYLALDNIELVAERLKALLGDGPFAFVAVNENTDMLRPEVRIESLSPPDFTDGESFKITEYAEGHRGISITTPRYHTSFGTYEPEERAITPEKRERRMSTCYFVFERGQFMVIQRTGAGGLTSWTFRPVTE